MTEKELEQIREGSIPLRYKDGKLEALTEPFYERMRFLEALAHGYMILWQREKIRKRCEKVKNGQAACQKNSERNDT